MYSWLVGLIVRRGFRRLNAGDLSALGMFAPHARFIFPGRHSFAADSRDPKEPWNMCVGVCFAGHFTLPDGSEYENPGMQYVRLR